MHSQTLGDQDASKMQPLTMTEMSKIMQNLKTPQPFLVDRCIEQCTRGRQTKARILPLPLTWEVMTIESVSTPNRKQSIKKTKITRDHSRSVGEIQYQSDIIDHEHCKAYKWQVNTTTRVPCRVNNKHEGYMVK